MPKLVILGVDGDTQLVALEGPYHDHSAGAIVSPNTKPRIGRLGSILAHSGGCWNAPGKTRPIEVPDLADKLATAAQILSQPGGASVWINV
ncbi:hypothetical protein FraQA3DRAFT_2398 [Frankia sp. QA3]|nr:hypothetical protein FraQA3DRAFT_2398 [Frankia sp. QA3]